MNMLFSMKTEKQNKLSFVDVGFIHKQGKFATTGYQKPTFSCVCSNLNFFPSVYKFCMVYTLVYKYFRICLYWTEFHTELSERNILQKRLP